MSTFDTYRALKTIVSGKADWFWEDRPVEKKDLPGVMLGGKQRCIWREGGVAGYFQAYANSLIGTFESDNGVSVTVGRFDVTFDGEDLSDLDKLEILCANMH